jgi:hypothetical protein
VDKLLTGVAAAVLIAQVTLAQSVAFNSGSLGAAGNGINGAGVTLGLAGAVSAGGDTSVGYHGIGDHTTVPFNSALNPSATSPFTIEFWVKPAVETTAQSTVPCPVFNRRSSETRSGWIFFQRPSSEGWNFRMYNGIGQSPGIDLTGGENQANAWSHLVAAWDGVSAFLYFNGALVDSDIGAYKANESAALSIGSYDSGLDAFNGSVDELAFYPTALSATQVSSHYVAAASLTPGFYSSLVIADGALEYLQQVPEPNCLSLVILSGAIFVWRQTRLPSIVAYC